MYSLIIISLLCLFDLNFCNGQDCGVLIPDPSPNTFYLIENNEKHKFGNDVFRKIVDPNLTFEVIPKNTNCHVTIEDMIQYADKGLLLINLYDLLNYNLTRPAKSLTYIKYPADPTIEQMEVCKSNKTKKYGEYETCTPSNETMLIYTVKIASNIIEKRNEKLFKAMLDFDFDYDFDFKKQKVINCNSPEYPSNRFDLKTFEVNATCEIKQDGFVKQDGFFALAPRSEDLELPLGLPTDIPIVFYDESYLTPDTKDYFKNAIVGVNTNYMKDGLLYFLKEMNWYRIAIITDDTEANKYFEEQLTPYLRENGVALISEICMSKDCNFYKIFKSLEENSIKIVVANVDQKNAGKLQKFSYVAHNRNRKWIVWDWSTAVAAEFTNYLGDVIIMSIENKYINAVNALNAIMKTGKYCKYCEYSNSNVAQRLQEILTSTSTYKFTLIKRSSTILVKKYFGFVTFKNGNLTGSDFVYPYREQVSDNSGSCAIKVSRIQDPCDDKDLIFLLLIIAVFFVTVLGIVYFFQSPIVSYQRIP